MQESTLSLMQMAKTSAALAKFDESGGLFISLLADPTYGGTTASFAMLGDVIFAEPKAMIGFAGGRVIAIDHPRRNCPKVSKRAEFLARQRLRRQDRHPSPTSAAQSPASIDYCGK